MFPFTWSQRRCSNFTWRGAEAKRSSHHFVVWALLTFWVDSRVVLRRSLLYLHANCIVECVMSQSSPSYITVAQSPLGAPQLRTDVRTQFITFANFWHFPGVIAVPAVSWFIWQLALRVLPAVTWLTVCRWLHIPMYHSHWKSNDSINWFCTIPTGRVIPVSNSLPQTPPHN